MLNIKDPETYLNFVLPYNDLLECQLECVLAWECVSFNYNSATSICELFYVQPLVSPTYADASLTAAQKYEVDNRNEFSKQFSGTRSFCLPPE